MRIASPLFSPKVYTKGEKKSVSHVNLQMDKADPPGGEGKGEREGREARRRRKIMQIGDRIKILLARRGSVCLSGEEKKVKYSLGGPTK